MGRFEIPSENHIDLRNEPELLDELVRRQALSAQLRNIEYRKKFPESTHMPSIDLAELEASRRRNSFNDQGVPHFEAEDDLIQLLQDTGRSWDSILFDEASEDIGGGLSYRLRDPEMAKLSWGLRNTKK